MFNEMRYSDYDGVISWELRDAIRRYYGTWEEVLDDEPAKRALWTRAIEQRRLAVVVLSSALLECSINFYLCTKCGAKRFKQIETDKRIGTFFGKCTEAPKEFLKSYSVLPDSELALDLRRLIDRRKAIVHPKPMLSIDGDNRHKGNEPSAKWDEHEFVGRCATLPFRFVDHLINEDPDCFRYMHTLRISCGRAAHEFETGQRRLEIAAKYPRELIKEIMDQGFDRNTAVLCAILIGDKPKVDESGNIVIQHSKAITLRPLKFFGMKRDPVAMNSITAESPQSSQ